MASLHLQSKLKIRLVMVACFMFTLFFLRKMAEMKVGFSHAHRIASEDQKTKKKTNRLNSESRNNVQTNCRG